MQSFSRGRLPDGARAFLRFMEARYACKLFDPTKTVPSALIGYLIECVRLSPTSFGLEQYRVIGVKEPALLSALARASGDQDPMKTAPLVFLFIAPRADAYAPDSDFVRDRARRFPGGLPVFIQDYAGYHALLRRENRVEEWARAQAYIGMANAMTGAAAAGLDSCAIEGFEEGAVLGALGLAPREWIACVMAAFGYRAEAKRERFRLDQGEMSEIR